MTKIQLRNLNQTSAANFRILIKPCAQSLNKSLALWPKVSSQINKLLPTSAIVTTSTSFEFAYSLFTRQGQINQVYWTGGTELVSEWVIELLTRVANDRTRFRWIMIWTNHFKLFGVSWSVHCSIASPDGMPCALFYCFYSTEASPYTASGHRWNPPSFKLLKVPELCDERSDFTF